MGKRQVISLFVALARPGWPAPAVLDVLVGVPGDVVFAVALMVALATRGPPSRPTRRLFGRVIARGRVTSSKAAITFDDGPSAEYTPPILDALAAAGVRATFFVLGRHVRAHPEIVAPDRGGGPRAGQPRRRPLAADVPGPDRHRPPAAVAGRRGRGRHRRASRRRCSAPRTGSAARSWCRWRAALGYRVVGWTAGVWDTAKPGVDRIVDRSVSELRPGAILLLHDADGSGAGETARRRCRRCPRSSPPATATASSS